MACRGEKEAVIKCRVYRRRRRRLRLVFALINGLQESVDLCKCQLWSSDQLCVENSLALAAVAVKKRGAFHPGAPGFPKCHHSFSQQEKKTRLPFPPERRGIRLVSGGRSLIGPIGVLECLCPPPPPVNSRVPPLITFTVSLIYPDNSSSFSGLPSSSDEWRPNQ